MKKLVLITLIFFISIFYNAFSEEKKDWKCNKKSLDIRLV